MLAERIGAHGDLVFFYALSPSLFAPVTEALQCAGLTGERTRLVLEKPIGRDLESSRRINAAIAAAVPESRVFRIDHYLGKETVQNLLALRFANALFEPLWNRRSIDHVQITVAETLGGRRPRPYYDDYGAIRDMLQNHMLQLLCLVAMEPPSRPRAGRGAQREGQGAALAAALHRAPRPSSRQRARPVRRRASSMGRPADELRGARSAGRPSTETFVALTAWIDNWRWAGVPFYLRTGKRHGRARHRDRHPVQAGAALDLRPARRSATWRPTGWSSSCSRPRTSR